MWRFLVWSCPLCLSLIYITTTSLSIFLHKYCLSKLSICLRRVSVSVCMCVYVCVSEWLRYVGHLCGCCVCVFLSFSCTFSVLFCGVVWLIPMQLIVWLWVMWVERVCENVSGFVLSMFNSPQVNHLLFVLHRFSYRSANDWTFMILSFYRSFHIHYFSFVLQHNVLDYVGSYIRRW